MTCESESHATTTCRGMRCVPKDGLNRRKDYKQILASVEFFVRESLFLHRVLDLPQTR